MESGVIPSGDISESSLWLLSSIYNGDSARLNNGVTAGAWVPETADTNQWVQVTFDVEMNIEGVQTQGYTVEEDVYMWVSTYKISYSTASSGALDSIQNSDGTSTFDVIFDGNYDSETIVTNYFDNVITARRIRILPQSWNNNIGLRFELLGCDTTTPVENLIPSSAPSCNYTEWDGSCTQRWVFTVVLQVDTSTATNEMPIDATGEFTFSFYTYECTDNDDRNTCSQLDIPDAIISNEITLQTTVEVTDDTKDTPRVYLKKVHGSDPTTDIRGGVQPGVSHLEVVTVDTHFFPQFLRSSLELELTLFMVCIGSEYNTGDGCLAAPPEDKYTAYVSNNFYYLLGSTELTSNDVTASSQTLDSHSYIHASEIHRIVFTNKALSATSRKYTITTVFRLIERTDRKKRDLTRRDVQDRVDEPIAVHQSILFRGCPPNSTHNAQELACICDNLGEEYSTETYQCKKSTQFVSLESEEIQPVDGGGSEAGDDNSDVQPDTKPDVNSAKSIQSVNILVYLFATIPLLSGLFLMKS